MEKIIISLEVVKAVSNDLHYFVKGDAFYGKHLLMDRINENLQGFIDDIKENYYMARGLIVPSNKETLYDACKAIKYPEAERGGREDIEILSNALKVALYTIEGFIRENLTTLTAGDNDLLGRISSDLQKSYGLLQRVML